MSKRGESRKEVAARGIEALSAMLAENDDRHEDYERAMADEAMKLEKIRQLEGRLDTVSAERDHYMRYATELTVKLQDILVLIQNSLQDAKVAAYKPPVGAPPLPKRTPLPDFGTMRKLVERLPVNGSDSEVPRD